MHFTRLFLASLFLLMLPFTFSAQPLTRTDAHGYSYQYFQNSLLQLRVYTLENGLKVYLAPNDDEPRIRTSIMVRSGSKHDPADATGLAHYLEHLLFHGTDKFGTLDFEKEAPLLRQIEQLFEQHRHAEGEQEKKHIYRTIDSLSYLASQYALPREYNDMMSAMGAWQVNAFTNFDRTGYISNIPANQLEKWLSLEAERFRNPQFRAFHTELETVYEEMNTIIDDGPRYALFQLYETIFPRHQYGSQTAIGKIEHLKNPSLSEIHKYYNAYYVPNNMALFLVGHFEPDETFRMIRDKFSYMKAGRLPVPEKIREAPIEQPLVRTIKAPGAEMLRMGFRFKGIRSDEAPMVKLIDMLLMNGHAGIFDLHINKEQRAQEVSTFVEGLNDHSVHVITGFPKEGQSLEELKNLILEQLDRLKRGDFPDWLQEAAINDLRKREMYQLESNDGRSGLLIKSYSFGIPWPELLAETESMRKITKKQIMAFAKQHYRNNYAVVYKQTGLDEKVKKISKPAITPIVLQENKRSTFRKEIEAMPNHPVDPRFLDFETDIEKAKLHNGVMVNAVNNKTNGLFTLKLSFDIGQNDDKLLKLAADYLPFAGTDQWTATQVQEAFYKIGCTFSLITRSTETSLFLTGLAEHLEEAVGLLDHLLTSVQADEEALEKLRSKVRKERSDWKESKYEIRRWASNYALYGSDSPYKNVFSEKEIKAIKADTLVAKIKSLMKQEHRVLFYGPQRAQELKAVLGNKLERAPKLQVGNKDNRYRHREPTTDEVFIAASETKQMDLVFLSNLQPFRPEASGMVYLFNEYFNGLFFKELRQARGLAYSAFCYISTPEQADLNYQLYARVGTQSDKHPEAIEAAYELIRDMPFNEQAFENARTAMMEKLRSERIVRFNILSEYENALKLGMGYELREDAYRSIPGISMEDFREFYEKTIKNNSLSLVIVGDKEEADEGQLEKYGKVSFLSHEEIFGF